MAYRTRYYPPLSIETNQLPTNVVVADKIAPGAVDGDKIEDGSIGTPDYAPGSVNSTALANNSVTTTKIASGAVTDDKLSTAPLTRPFAPQISTAELANGSVTAEKMAAAIIDTAQIVDGAVTTVKIEAAAIDSTKLQVNSVTSTAILDGAVGDPELGTDSVITVKIKDANVTTAKIADQAITNEKLALDHLALFNRDNPTYVDDFIGAALMAPWAASGDVGGVAAMLARSRVNIRTGATNNDIFRLNFNGVLTFDVQDLPKFYTQTQVPDLTNVIVRIGLRLSATEFIYFLYDSTVDANWHITTRDGGATTDTDTGIAVTSARQQLRFEYISNAEVNFYIADALVATSVANIPGPTGDAEAWLEVETQEAVLKQLNLDYVIVDYDRAT